VRVPPDGRDLQDLTGLDVGRVLDLRVGGQKGGYGDVEVRRDRRHRVALLDCVFVEGGLCRRRRRRGSDDGDRNLASRLPSADAIPRQLATSAVAAKFLLKAGLRLVQLGRAERAD
jgi:hypothetical protein